MRVSAEKSGLGFKSSVFVGCGDWCGGDKAMEGAQSANRFRRIPRHSGNGGTAAHLKLDVLVSIWSTRAFESLVSIKSVDYCSF